MSMGWIPRLICAVIGAAALATTTPSHRLNLVIWFVGGCVGIFPMTLPWPAHGRGKE